MVAAGSIVTGGMMLILKADGKAAHTTISGVMTGWLLWRGENEGGAWRLRYTTDNHHSVPDISWQHGSSMLSPVKNTVILQCFDAVGCVTGRASGLQHFCRNNSQEFTFGDWPNLAQLQKNGLAKQKPTVCATTITKSENISHYHAIPLCKWDLFWRMQVSPDTIINDEWARQRMSSSSDTSMLLITKHYHINVIVLFIPPPKWPILCRVGR